MTDSFFANYFKEFYGDETYQNEHGFAVYRYLGQGQVYIVHIYVRPHSRKMKIAAEIADKVGEIAKENGCREILGSVVPTAKESSTSLKVLLGYGMELKKIQDGMLIFSKGIK